MIMDDSKTILFCKELLGLWDKQLCKYVCGNSGDALMSAQHPIEIYEACFYNMS